MQSVDGFLRESQAFRALAGSVPVAFASILTEV
jgi:hypothetical protein